MSSALSVLASTQNQFASNSGGMTPPQLVVAPVNSTQIVSAEGVAARSFTILPGQSGQIIQIPLLTLQGANAITITLPNPVQNPGFNCKFVKTTGPTANQAITIDSGGAGLMAFVSLQNAANMTASGACRTVSFLGGAAPPTVAGDSIEVYSNGVGYIAKGYASVAASLGFA